jgi:DNA-binding transcriptional LysR family regulator
MSNDGHLMDKKWPWWQDRFLMDLDELRAFVAVVETGSIVAAARSLNFARATLRRRLDELEARAGVPLLHRTAQGVTPTEAGAVLAARGRSILEEANALISSVREVGAEPAGELRFMLPVGMPPQIVTPLFAALHQRYPRLSFRVRFSEDPLRGLLDNVDVAVHFESRSPGSWVSYEILRVREWLVASRDYLSRKGTPEKPDDLVDHDLLAWESPDGDPTLWPARNGGPIRVAPQMISTDIHMLRRCAAAGMGIAFLPDAGIPEQSSRGDRLVPVLPDAVGRERPLRVAVPAALSDIPRIRAVLTEIQTFLAESQTVSTS